MFFSFEHVKGEAPHLTHFVPQTRRNAVFGVRPCDGQGAVRMDRVFGDHAEDVYYRSRRDNLAYGGLACNRPAGSNCFCLSVGGSPVSTEGLDVLMTDLGDRYFVTGVTETGKALMAAAGDLLAKPAAPDRQQAQGAHAEAPGVEDGRPPGARRQEGELRAGQQESPGAAAAQDVPGIVGGSSAPPGPQPKVIVGLILPQASKEVPPPPVEPGERVVETGEC